MDMYQFAKLGNFSNLNVNFSLDNLSFDHSRMLQDFKESMYTYKQPTTIVLISIYAPLFIISMVGNILVLLIVLLNKNMRSVTNYFIVNLAIADLLVTIACMPLTLGEIVYKVWIYGEFLCKCTGYIQGVSLSASVLTLTLMSIDRWLVIRHPVKARRYSTVGHAKILIVIIWIISTVIMIPLVIVRELKVMPIILDAVHKRCVESWTYEESRQIYDLFLLVIIYVIPGCVLVTSYSITGCRLMSTSRVLQRSDSQMTQTNHVKAGRRRLAQMLVILAIVFAVSWLPYYIVNLYLNFTDISDEADNPYLQALPFTLLLGHSHSAQNPVIYCIMNPNFSKCLRNLVKCDSMQDIGSPTKEKRFSWNSSGRNTASMRQSSAKLLNNNPGSGSGRRSRGLTGSTSSRNSDDQPVIYSYTQNQAKPYTHSGGGMEYQLVNNNSSNPASIDGATDHVTRNGISRRDYTALAVDDSDIHQTQHVNGPRTVHDELSPINEESNSAVNVVVDIRDILPGAGTCADL